MASAERTAKILAPFFAAEFQRYIEKTPARMRIAEAIAELLPRRGPEDPSVRLRDFFIEDHLDASQIKSIGKQLANDRPLSSNTTGLRHLQYCSVCRAIAEAVAARIITERESKRLRRSSPSSGRKIPEGITDHSRNYMRGPKSRF